MLRVAVAAILPVATALPAAASPDCASREAVVGYLEQEFAEAPVAMGLANNGGMIEVLANDERRTFSIVITMPDGETCLIAAGHGWEEVPPPAPTAAPGEGEPAA